MLLTPRIAAMRRPPIIGGGDLEYVGGVDGEANAATTPFSISLTSLTGGLGTAPEADDTVIVTYGSGSTNGAGDLALGVTTPGYAELVNLYEENTFRTNYFAAWKRMGTTPDTAVSIIRPTTNAAYTFAVHVWRNAHPTTPIDVPPVPAQGPQGRPALGAITPITPGAIILGGAVIAAEPNSNAQVLTSNLDNFIEHRMTNSSFTWRLIGLGSKEWTGGLYTPTQWGGGSTDNRASWAGMTLALRPS